MTNLQTCSIKRNIGFEKCNTSTKRYFQGNSEARCIEIIQKWGIGFQNNKNLSLLLIFDGNI